MWGSKTEDFLVHHRPKSIVTSKPDIRIWKYVWSPNVEAEEQIKVRVLDIMENVFGTMKDHFYNEKPSWSLDANYANKTFSPLRVWSHGTWKKHTQELPAALGALIAEHPHAPPHTAHDPGHSRERRTCKWAGPGPCLLESPPKRHVPFQARLSMIWHILGAVSMRTGAGQPQNTRHMDSKPAGRTKLLVWSLL